MLTIELPRQENQTAVNLQRWTELLQDRDLAKIEGRIETDRFGRIIMSPPPGQEHGGYQFKVGQILANLMPGGRVTTECPISTADGVKAADVAWASDECLRKLGVNPVFPVAPEICVEVMSPSNTREEMDEKMALYFDAGAKEVWLCDRGQMQFFTSTDNHRRSQLCPEFPAQLKL
jgi:Uma2 family endonuclease